MAKTKTETKSKRVKKKPVEWTPARKHSFIVSQLRAGSRRWPAIFECLNEAKTEKKTNVKTGRLAQHYRCACCGDDFSQTNVSVDHLLPVVCPEKGFETWDKFIERLFCEKGNLQVLCKECHKIKCGDERDIRTKQRRKKNK